jgi:hypothetical protein
MAMRSGLFLAAIAIAACGRAEDTGMNPGVSPSPTSPPPAAPSSASVAPDASTPPARSREEELAAAVAAAEPPDTSTGSLDKVKAPETPHTVSPHYKPHDPVTCKGEEYVALVQADIRGGSRPAVTASGSCHVAIRVSRLASDGIAVSVSGSASVDISHSQVTGGTAAVQAVDSATVEAKDSELRGGMKSTGKARFDDQGGNSFE